jgi:large subunit ribosomal protein L24
MSKWIKKDDKVVVLTGNNKGTIADVLARKGDKVLIKGVNVRKRHLKKRDENSTSQIVEIERAIHISNVALSDVDGKPVKAKIVINANGDRELHTSRNGQTNFLRTIKKAKS